MRYMMSSQVDDAGRPRTSLMASVLTLLRFAIAVGMSRNVPRLNAVASGSFAQKMSYIRFRKDSPASSEERGSLEGMRFVVQAGQAN